MGTPMAVNFANLFMSQFETKLLEDYATLYGKSPVSWVRFIDDIFFVWKDDLKSLNHFLSFCNSYAAKNKYNSNIKFTSEYSSSNVVFLDTRVKIQDGKILTELYSKPTATHTYLHNSSDHPPHTIRSNPLSQFIRIRRICTLINDYRKHASEFVKFYVQRGYSRGKMIRIAEVVAQKDRQELLQPKAKISSISNQRIPLVVNWHQKFKGISKLLHGNYRTMIDEHPKLKNVFPEPPIVSFRRNTNIRATLIQSEQKIRRNGYSVRCTQKGTKKRGRPCKLCSHMGQVDKLHNINSGKSCLIEGGNCSTKNVIYAAECRKHKQLYVGYTSTTLSQRFNKHRSDAKHDPDATELGRHFFESHDCDFDRDLTVHILQNVEGDHNTLEFYENVWMTRLDTREPRGLNNTMNEFGRTYYKLFPKT